MMPRSLVVCAILALALPFVRAADRPDPAASLLGINLDGLCDWNSELPFNDLMRLARPWVSQKQGQPWGKGPALDLDARGQVRRLDEGCSAETMLLTIPGHYPIGEYVCLYAGSGQVELRGMAREVERKPGRIVFVPRPDHGGSLAITRTDPQDPVRDIRVLMPGSEATHRTETFHPTFLARWRGFNTLRFMDWMHTNGSKLVSWDDRPRVEDATWAHKGAPVEVMVDLCNRLKANPWFCMPHLADDGFVRGFAQVVKERLDPTLKIHVEYSNEVWNGMFAQNRHAQEMAKKLGLGDAKRPWEGAALYHARRSLEIFRIWEEVLGGRERLVRVLAWQAAGGAYWTDTMLLTPNGTAKQVDVLAIAPYITMCIPATVKDGKGIDAATVAGWDLDRLFAHIIESTALPECIAWMQTQAAVAKKHGVRLMAYEGGQHLVGVGGGENNEAMMKLFHAANRDPRMGATYLRYLDAWRAVGGDTFCLFSSIGRWSKWGSWGLGEWADDTPQTAPKLKAAYEWNARNTR